MSAPKILNAPDSIWLNYGDIEEDCTHTEVYREGEISWCEDKQEDHDVKYIRADIVVALQEEINALRGQNDVIHLTNQRSRIRIVL